MVCNKEYIIVKANLLYRLNPLTPYILRLVLSTIETTFILFFAYKLRQARHLSEERVKECKENKPTYPFLSVNKVILSLLIAVELPPFINSILYLFNNNFLFDLIVLKISLITYIAYKLADWLRSIFFYPPLEPLIGVA